MVDPTSDLNEDLSAAEAPNCHTCGDALVQDTDHIVVTWVDDDAVQTRHFCGESCRAEWDDDA